VILLLAALAVSASAQVRVMEPRTQVIAEKMLPGGEGESINGPSLIRVPAWVKSPLGKYYLYFAHHQGKYIRMAYADSVTGPWKIHAGGVLRLDQQKVVTGHIASPDAVIDDARQEIVLFYHGGRRSAAGVNEGQRSAAATSSDGLHFAPLNLVVGAAYLRVFSHGGAWYSLVGSGELGRTTDLHQPFAKVADIIGDEIVAAIAPRDLPSDRKGAKGRERFSIRHVGVDIESGRLLIYFTCVGHKPERILAAAVPLDGPPEKWRSTAAFEVMRAREEWEGGRRPVVHSFGGISREMENSLRDPTIFREGGKVWLIYAAAGEHGMGLAPIEYRR
jgi:hypothetical protein